MTERKISFEILPGVPGTGSKIYHFHEKEGTFSEGLAVKFTLEDGSAWIGNFQFGDYDLSGIFEFDDKQSVCVVARGVGYFLYVKKPSNYEVLSCYPIIEVRAVPHRQIFVFADFTKLTAYGPQGLLWKTPRISWDGIKITEVTPELIIGLAWDSPKQQNERFEIDVITGHHRGGAQFF